jgi:hypothetical protein
LFANFYDKNYDELETKNLILFGQKKTKLSLTTTVVFLILRLMPQLNNHSQIYDNFALKNTFHINHDEKSTIPVLR